MPAAKRSIATIEEMIRKMISMSYVHVKIIINSQPNMNII